MSSVSTAEATGTYDASDGTEYQDSYESGTAGSETSGYDSHGTGTEDDGSGSAGGSSAAAGGSSAEAGGGSSTAGSDVSDGSERNSQDGSHISNENASTSNVHSRSSFGRKQSFGDDGDVRSSVRGRSSSRKTTKKSNRALWGAIAASAALLALVGGAGIHQHRQRTAEKERFAAVAQGLEEEKAQTQAMLESNQVQLSNLQEEIQDLSLSLEDKTREADRHRIRALKAEERVPALNLAIATTEGEMQEWQVRAQEAVEEQQQQDAEATEPGPEVQRAEKHVKMLQSHVEMLREELSLARAEIDDSASSDEAQKRQLEEQREKYEKDLQEKDTAATQLMSTNAGLAAENTQLLDDLQDLNILVPPEKRKPLRTLGENEYAKQLLDLKMKNEALRKALQSGVAADGLPSAEDLKLQEADSLIHHFAYQYWKQQTAEANRSAGVPVAEVHNIVAKDVRANMKLFRARVTAGLKGGFTRVNVPKTPKMPNDKDFKERAKQAYAELIKQIPDTKKGNMFNKSKLQAQEVSNIVAAVRAYFSLEDEQRKRQREQTAALEHLLASVKALGIDEEKAAELVSAANIFAVKAPEDAGIFSASFISLGGASSAADTKAPADKGKQ